MKYHIMSYEFDIFLSYNRKFPHGEWVEDVFYPLFKPYLEDALNKDINIFKDTEEIKGGSAWKNKIKSALAHSKCMVAIWSPAYFRSEWCMKEYAVINYRQNKLGYLTNENPSGLVIPVQLFDGIHYPQFAKDIQALDCREYNRVGNGMKQTTLYSDFQGLLQKWVTNIAGVIDGVPDWDSTWLEASWLDDPFDNQQNSDSCKMSRPKL